MPISMLAFDAKPALFANRLIATGRVSAGSGKIA